MKKYFLIPFLIAAIYSGHAQQIPLSSQYFFNPMTYNPALTGADERTNLFLMHHSLWNGMPGAPAATSLTAESPLKGKKVGLGGSVYNYRFDLVEQFALHSFYSYRADLSENQKIYLGASLGIVDTRIDFSKAVVKDMDDPFLLNGNRKKTSADANAGLVYRNKQTELGFALGNITGSSSVYSANNLNSKYSSSRNYSTSLKQTFFINKEKNISTYPFVVLRFVRGAPLQYDACVVGNWKDRFWLGISYHSHYAISTSVRFKIYDSFGMGYTYDYITSAIGAYAGSSNEFTMSYSLDKSKKNAEDIVIKKYEEEIAALSKKLNEIEEKLSKAADVEKIMEEIKQMQSQMEQMKKEAGDSSTNLKTQIMLLEERINTLMKLLGN